MRPDPNHVWTSDYSQDYEANIYGKGLQGYVMRKSHDLVEADFDENTHISRVLEVGAGTGVHLESVQHTFDEYVMTDLHDDMLQERHGEKTGVVVKVEDATQLSFENETFDRVIASHVLEHLYKPHLVLREWDRVLKPGGVLSLVLPCDPGLMWRFGRTIGPRKRGSQFSVDYDCVMALEHVNSITSLKALINYYFEKRNERWWPVNIAFSDINLIYTVNIYK